MHRTPIIATIVIASAVTSFFSVATVAGEWGSLKGRIVVDGVLPSPEPLVVTGDQFCMHKRPVDESVLVGEDGGLANVAVYIRLGRRDTIEVHPDYEAQLSEPVELDNVACSFIPRVTLLRVGQPLALKNSDPVGHNTNLVGLFNEIIATGEEKVKTVSRAAPLPMPVTCNIHPFMQGFVLVQDHPYMATTAENGTFEIALIPAGTHQFAFWHEVTGYVSNLRVGDGTTDRRGQVELTIATGETIDLGEIRVPAALLKRGR